MKGDGVLGRQINASAVEAHQLHGQQDFCRPWLLPIALGGRRGKGFFRDKYFVLHAEVLPNNIYNEYRPDQMLVLAQGGDVRLSPEEQQKLDPKLLALLQDARKDQVQANARALYDEALQHLVILQVIGFNPAVKEGLTPDPEKYWVFRVGQGINPKAGLLVPVTGNDFSVPKGVKPGQARTAVIPARGDLPGTPGYLGQDPAQTQAEAGAMLGELQGESQTRFNVAGAPAEGETHVTSGDGSSAVVATPDSVRVDSAGAQPANPGVANGGNYTEPECPPSG